MTQVLNDVGFAQGRGDDAALEMVDSAVILKMDWKNLCRDLMWAEIEPGAREKARIWVSAVEGMTGSQEKGWVVRVGAWAGQSEQASLSQEAN